MMQNNSEAQWADAMLERYPLLLFSCLNLAMRKVPTKGERKIFVGKEFFNMTLLFDFSNTVTFHLFPPTRIWWINKIKGQIKFLDANEL